MAKFDKDVFTDHIKQITDQGNADALADALLKYKYNNKTDWETYKKALCDIIDQHGITRRKPDSGYPFDVPEIDSVDVSDIENIKKYLDFTKGMHIESEICCYLVGSPTLVYKYKEDNGEETFEISDDIKYDYMEQLFNKYKDGRNSTDKKKNFNLIYAVYLITGKISVAMMYNIINAYGNEVTDGFSKALTPVFSKTNLSDDAAVDTLMQIIHILRVPRNLRVPRYADKNKAIAAYLIKRCFKKDFYDPRSFVQIIYYYATVNDIPYDEMSILFKDTVLIVMDKVLDGIVEPKRRRDLFYNQGIEPEKWISMDNYRKTDSSVMKALREASGLNNKELFDRMEKNVRPIVRPIGDEEETKQITTYEIFCDQILTKMDYKQKPFIDYITNSKKFYEGFFKEHISYSRSMEFNITPNCDIEIMAYEIVFNNVMHKAKIYQNKKHYGLYKFTSINFKNMTEQKRKVYLRREISDCFDFVTKYEGNNEKIKEIANYPTIAGESGSRDEFIDQLVEQILIYADILLEHNPADRKGVLYKWFEQCCRDGGSAYDFTNEVDDKAQGLNFDGFNPLRFHDAFLFLCMKTGSPRETFNKLNDMDGYSYWDN
ncbi:hypothetical protein [Ruminococcus albus]|uniref:Uncharacterized protein n=1 Tax=Ruminococcus albus TaxID=1264 RepID=A0A1I1R6U8_RUMAL|nr:hypothetical protein [Ruminococcus albus]SFD30114.1 hypothetical protein SAMN02910406_03615 [Ruminococcus albus]